MWKTIALILSAVVQLVICYKKDGKCHKPINLLLTLDASGSIEPDSWQSEIDLSKEIIQSLAINDSGNSFGIMDFSTKAKVDSNIDKSPQKAIAALDALQSDSRDAHSFIDSALNEASVLLQSSKTATHLNILVIMTDGYMTLKDGKKDMFHLSPAKEKLAAAGATVFAVGVGKYINQEALNFIASDPPASHVFQIGDAKVISDKIFQASEVSCATVGNNDTKGQGGAQTLKCGKVSLERIGCFKDKQAHPRPLPDLILTDRDSTSPVFSGHVINWKQWDTYLPGFVCRCAEETVKRGRKLFGLQFYGECWSNAKTDTFDKDGPADSDSNCKSLGYKPCDKTAMHCVGEKEHNFVYKIKG